MGFQKGNDLISEQFFGPPPPPPWKPHYPMYHWCLSLLIFVNCGTHFLGIVCGIRIAYKSSYKQYLWEFFYSVLLTSLLIYNIRGSWDWPRRKMAAIFESPS